MNDEFGGTIMKEIIGLKNTSDEDKKVKVTKTCVIKRKLRFEDYKNYLVTVQFQNKKTIKNKIKLM